MTKKDMNYAQEIELVPIDDLFPYINNARTHDENQIDQIVASMTEFGFTNPVLIDGDNGLIAGHGRIMAAQKLGLKTVPVIKLTHLTENQKKAYIIADNKLALNAGWDMDLLRVEYDALTDADYDVSLTGFEPEFFEPDDEDLFPEDDTEKASDPKKTDDGYVEFSIVLEKLNRDQLMKKLQQLRSDLNLDTLEQSLMALVHNDG